MLSRNQIRIKILHCIYSSYIKNDFKNIEFKNSFDDYKNLYRRILEILIYVKNRADFEIQHGLKKNIATEDDLNPNTKFTNNIILQKISKDIKSELNDDEKKIISKKIFFKIKSRKYFKSYMEKENTNIEEEKKIIQKIIKEELFNGPEIFDYLENKSIYWNDDLFAVQILLSKMITDYTPNSKKKLNFKKTEIFKNSEDKNFANKLFSKTLKKREENIKIIHKLAKNWDFERISTLDSILIQLAITEMTEFESIPYKVSINEYIEIAKIYSTKKSHEFINGILDAFLKKKILI